MFESKQNAHLVTEGGRFLSLKDKLGKSWRDALFGNPAVLPLRTRGFASPDFSGFALFGDLVVFQMFGNYYSLWHLKWRRSRCICIISQALMIGLIAQGMPNS